MVHLFDSLVRTIPDGVVLTSIKQEGQKLTLEGRSQSNARVSTYLRNLESSGWMTNPDLAIIEARAGEPGLPFTFRLSVTLANPNAPRDLDGDGIPDEPAAPVAAAAADMPVPAVEPAPAPAMDEAPAPAGDTAAPAADEPPPADGETAPAAEEGAQ
jgi:type IV pilus assembly protein PilN